MSNNFSGLLLDDKQADTKEPYMRMLFITLSIVIGFIGFVFIILGGIHPRKYQEALSDPVSAVQVTQVYTEATYTITVGIGIISIAVLVAVIGILFQTSKPLEPDAQL